MNEPHGWLTNEQLITLAQKAQWYFDCDYHDGSDVVTFTGDGVGDLDQLIARLFSPVYNRITITCLLGDNWDDRVPCNKYDVVNLRWFYIQIQGQVNKPILGVYPNQTTS